MKDIKNQVQIQSPTTFSLQSSTDQSNYTISSQSNSISSNSGNDESMLSVDQIQQQIQLQTHKLRNSNMKLHSNSTRPSPRTSKQSPREIQSAYSYDSTQSSLTTTSSQGLQNQNIFNHQTPNGHLEPQETKTDPKYLISPQQSITSSNDSYSNSPSFSPISPRLIEGQDPVYSQTASVSSASVTSPYQNYSELVLSMPNTPAYKSNDVEQQNGNIFHLYTPPYLKRDTPYDIKDGNMNMNIDQQINPQFSYYDADCKDSIYSNYADLSSVALLAQLV
ncbi:MAG: hypothetical protein EZS28_014744 [Streblomastix strix]|uniref:Uncharacterized protein n=1 Tax=Streblomastix strix TaxID=222440 RepID=A0A5J4W4B7_9EUKA|nr:MAG: hypothetical protein EZS28_014744 [Streblomastix strix]